MVIYISTILAAVSFLGIVGMMSLRFWKIKKHKIDTSSQEDNFFGVNVLLQSVYNSIMNYIYRYSRKCAIHTVHIPRKAGLIVVGNRSVVNLRNLIKGRGDTKSKTEPASPYLKDITEHKNNIRNGVKK